MPIRSTEIRNFSEETALKSVATFRGSLDYYYDADNDDGDDSHSDPDDDDNDDTLQETKMGAHEHD